MPTDKNNLVLVVEDEPDIREIVCMVLEEHGMRAEGAGDGQEALAWLAGNQALPALIILDLMMPRMDGWQFREALARSPRLERIPVLVLSGDGHVEEKAQALGAAGYLRKPIGLEALLKNVEDQLPHG
jgi:two-component system response regulator MprA